MPRTRETMAITEAPDCTGWTWKQVVMGGFMAVAMAINRVANAIHETAGAPDERS